MEDKLQDGSENVEMSWLSEAPILAVQKLFQEVHFSLHIQKRAHFCPFDHRLTKGRGGKAVHSLISQGLDEEGFAENGITVQLGKQEVYLDVTPIVDATLSIEDSSTENGEKSLTQQSNALASKSSP